MDQELVIKALKSACGNKNFRFQIIVQDSQLHIYINRKTDQQPDYSFLIDRVTLAIASLSLDSLDGIWLYSRQLGEVEPDWQAFVELSTETNSDNINEINTISNFPDFEDFPEDDSAGDTGLLHDTGMIHGKPFKEEQIDTFVSKLTETEVEATNNLDSNNISLAQYCFVSNKQLLTSDIISPDKETIRLVKFFHHLSDNNKQKILPALDSYFKLAKTPNIEKLSVAVQKWFKQIAELNDDRRRLVAIWLSRYCFDSSATLAEFKTVIEKNAAITTVKKTKRSNTEYSFTPADTDNKETISDDEQLDHLPQEKFKLPPLVKKLGLPFVWTLATLVLMMLGIYTSNPEAGITSQKIPSLCNSTIGSANYCRLAINLAGENTIKQSPQSIFPLTEVTETLATYGCQRYANLKAGVSGNVDPQQTPVISSYGEKILPHIYVVEAKQKSVEQPENIRVGCVYTTGQGERSPKLLAADIIPQNWPAEHYQKQVDSKSNVSFGIYTNLVNLGLYTIFAAVGIAIASKFNLGIKVNHPQTIYLVALILGVVQLIAGELPVLGLVVNIALPILTILATSLLIKDFEINRHDGYYLVVAGILTIIAIQFLLYGLCLSLINLIA